jgi:hypothetical protein
MHLSAMDKLLWAGGFVCTLLLLLVLLVRSRWRQFPIFTAYAAFGVVRTAALFTAYSHRWFALYTHIYLLGLVVDFALQLGIAIEIARIVLRPTGTWVHDAKMQFAVAGLLGAAAAAALAWWISPPAQTAIVAWRLRGNLFTSLVICELVVVMSLTASRLGLGWRNHVMAVGQGLTVWTGVMVVTTALQSFLGGQRLYLEIDHFRVFAYIGAVVWWMIQLWIPEPERQPIAPELQSYIVELHRRVEYDLHKLDARR